MKSLAAARNEDIQVYILPDLTIEHVRLHIYFDRINFFAAVELE